MPTNMISRRCRFLGKKCFCIDFFKVGLVVLVLRGKKVSKNNCLLSEVCEVSSQAHLGAKVHHHASKYRPKQL